MEEQKQLTVEGLSEADANGDGHISNQELEMYLEFKRRELEDADAQRDAMRKMAWFALFGMLLYPVTIMFTSWLDVDDAAKIIGDIAPTYFVAIAGLVAAFFGANAYSNAAAKKSETPPPPLRPVPPPPRPMAPAPTAPVTPAATEAPAVPKVSVPKITVPSKE
jgi:hypothetical protein